MLKGETSKHHLPREVWSPSQETDHLFPFFLMSAFGSTVGLKKILAGGWTNQPIWKNMLVKLELISPNFPGWKITQKTIWKNQDHPICGETSFFQIWAPRPSKCSFPVCSPPGAASCPTIRNSMIWESKS